MTTLLDGHNAIHVLGLAGKPPEESRRSLLLLAADRAEADLEVHFDARSAPPGLPKVGREHGVPVHYHRKEPADEAIVRRVREAAPPSAILVVTDDRELRGRVRQLGGRVAGIREFFADTEPPPPEEKRLTGRPLRPEDFGLPEKVNLRHPPRDLR